MEDVTGHARVRYSATSQLSENLCPEKSLALDKTVNSSGKINGDKPMNLINFVCRIIEGVLRGIYRL